MADEKENISWSANWEIKQIEDAAKKLRADVIRLENALDESTGVVQQFEPYTELKNLTSYRPRNPKFSSPQRAREAAKGVYDKSLVVKERNDEIAKANTALLSKLAQLLTNAGLPKTYSKTEYHGRRSKAVTVDHDWYEALRICVPTFHGWSDLERRYKDFLRQCDDWEREIADAERKKQQEVAAQEAKAKHDRVLGTLMVKYQMPLQADASELVDTILGKNKYLRLAHYLHLNRGDWSDGPDYAETGLNGFVEETETDKKISECLWPLITDWDGDGRVFRDCEWSYDRLFGLVSDLNPELLADYEAASEFCN
jgi:hypothetical protein